VTAVNVGSFPGKQIFSQATARVHGSVFFTDANGIAAQPMQGVNVVARWIDPSTGLPSRSDVVASVSGFLFCGNAGNMITGFTDGSGQNFNRLGSADATLEGFFDLAGLQIPNGANSAQYELTVEAVDPLWSANVGPYGATSQVQPSGLAGQIIVNVTLGGDVAQDILMQGSALQKAQWYGATSYAAPAQIAGSGNWAGALSGYGTVDFFQFPAQANRTLSVMVDGLDELGSLSEGKSLPVVGMWDLVDPGMTPAPANTVSAFNTTFFGETRLDAQILQSTTFRLGIADYRGDGRPDYHYNARVLYGDNANPPRASVAGGTAITIKGLGLQIDTSVEAGGITTPVLASSSTQLLIDTPALVDGAYDLLLGDAKSGGSSDMTGVLTAGAGPSDLIKLISGANPATPVGGQAPVPFTVIVVAADGVTPVAGATVQFTASASVGSSAVAFSACGGATTCTLVSDQSGLASSFMTPLSAAVMTVTAKLAPASYPSPQQVQVTLLGTESQLDLSLITPSVWIAQGATVSIPLNARVLSNGAGVMGSGVTYQITQGPGLLSAAKALTDSNGYASVSLQINAAAASVRVSVCVGATNNPCQVFNATVVQSSALKVIAVAGTLQMAPSGQSFQPVIVRVTDSASPPHPVMGAGVVFLSYVGRMPGNEAIVWAGEAGISQPGMPLILSKSVATVSSDIIGLASLQISISGISGNVAVVGSATAGSSSVQFEAQQFGP
jgi:hypothetical protein